MYGGFEVYKTYLAVKLHFTSKSYDYHKYGGKINCKLDTFTKRNDRYFFHKLSIKYKQEEILDFFVSNFIKDEKKWIGSLLQNDGQDIYLDYKKRQDSFKYHFRRLLRLLLQKKTSIQTIVVLNEVLSFTKNWNKEIAEKVVWPKISSTIAKLKGFMKYNKTECKLIIKEVFLNV